MIQKLKMTLLSFSSLFMFLAPSVAGGVVYAGTDTNIQGSLCKGADLNLRNPGTPGSDSECQTEDPGGSLTKLIATIINIISVIVGAIAVIMIIIGGFRYVTSGGNDSSVASAKNTILYALIGLIIVALAQIVVKFVLGGVATSF